MTTARKSASKAKPQARNKQPAIPHGPSEGKGKSAARMQAHKAAPKAAKPLSPWEAWKVAQESIDVLCDHVVSGGHLAEFCRARSFSYTRMLRWLEAEPSRAEMYARARETRSDLLAEEIVAISDEAEVSAKHDGEDVRLALDAAAVARNRLRVDARKWIAAKLKPRVYGDKTTTEVTGPGGGAVQHSLTVTFVDPVQREGGGE